MTIMQDPEWYEAGSGTPLVLVHGFTVSWRIWKPVLPLLEKHHRVIAPTLPGHVGGLPLKERASPLSIARALAEQLRERGIGDAHFAGQSLGGWMVFEMARFGLARSALGLCSAGAWRDPAVIEKFVRDGRSALRLLPYLAPVMKLAVNFTPLRRLALAREMQHGDRMEVEDAREHFARFSKMTILEEFLDEKLEPLQPLPADNKVPLRVVWGARDRILPFDDFGQPLLDVLGLDACTVLEDCGHNPMFDDPQRVANEILDFTREVESGR
ncbi:alpha/beta fold hydrolase [Solimonas terrae]|uniref:Alpha/beta fold hydrolase n=1 Tax=Solimonas terrae TaxID=1396819 RepID=A0A6M2BLQ1_9GAMM|nr:alpha/beta fold hydrolase [Solimonas terrae]NGY03270.1 alpha/beta fold hydrolase [Solimonas terrae]